MIYDDDSDWIRDSDGNVVPVWIYELKEWRMVSCRWDETETVPDASAGVSAEDKPKPYMLKREPKEDGKEYWENHKDYVGIVYQKPKQHVLKQVSENPNPFGMLYFAQAEIYIPEGVSPIPSTNAGVYEWSSSTSCPKS
ncbi:MAG: hypothetical protein MZV63_63445 [Marinilabiliales bacterium]|nr:hypothetical protein [Marinilabiliales bacterium]